MRSGHNLVIGDNVRVVGLPTDLPIGDDRLPTRATFEKCVGETFAVAGFNEIGWVELSIEPLTGNVGETIWIEPDLLEVASR